MILKFNGVIIRVEGDGEGGGFCVFRNEKRNGVTRFRSVSTKAYFMSPQVWRSLLTFQCGGA